VLKSGSVMCGWWRVEVSLPHRLAAVAIRSSTLEAAGLRFDSLEAGPVAGELVLLLHGFPQSAACWEPALESLAAAGYRAVAFSQRGYSAGAMPDGVDAYRLSEACADVLAVAGALGRERFHLIGHDWGGSVAWAAAASTPARVASLTSISTPHLRALARALRGTLQQRLRMAYVPVLRLPAVPETLFTLAGGALAVEALVATGLEREHAQRDVDHLREIGPRNALNWYRAIGRERLRAGAVTVPTLYIWGDSDPAFGRAAAEATEEFVDAPYHFVELQDATHWIPDQHWPDIEDLVLEHIGGHRAATAA
jgi:pimeloyl-ACP methyl ester carboxylesterase